MPSDLRTKSIVLRRLNYGESDRILHLLTPEGKFAVLARAVRKEKSRLAGGIELFGVADVVIHQGRSQLATLTSAKMLRFFSNVLSDISTLELASTFLKKLDRAAEQSDNPEYFSLLEQSLAGLNAGLSRELVLSWFTLNFAEATGETINFTVDLNGAPLNQDTHYFWDGVERALRRDERGNIDAATIKFARLLLKYRLQQVAKVQNYTDLLPNLAAVVRTFE